MMGRLTLRRHRCVSLLALAEGAWRRLNDFFDVEQCAATDPLPDDTAALIVHTCMLDRLACAELPAAMRSVTVVGHRVPQDFIDVMQARNVLVTCPRIEHPEQDEQAMEVCQDVMAAFGFGRLGARPRNVLNDMLLCDCC